MYGGYYTPKLCLEDIWTTSSKDYIYLSPESETDDLEDRYVPVEFAKIVSSWTIAGCISGVVRAVQALRS